MGWVQAMLSVLTALGIVLACALAGDPRRYAGKKTNAVRGHCRSPRPFRVLAAHHRFLRLRVPIFIAVHQRSGMTGLYPHRMEYRQRIFAGIRIGFPLRLLYLPGDYVITGFLLMPIKETTELVFAVLIGLLWLGTVPITSALVAQIFASPISAYSSATSWVRFPVVARRIRFRSSYDIVWGVAVVLGSRPRSIYRSPTHPSQVFKKTPLKAYHQNGRRMAGRIRGTSTGIPCPCCVAPSATSPAIGQCARPSVDDCARSWAAAHRRCRRVHHRFDFLQRSRQLGHRSAHNRRRVRDKDSCNKAAAPARISARNREER